MARRNTLKVKDVDKGTDGQPADGTLKRNYLAGPLVVDPVSQQLVDSRYVPTFLYLAAT